MPSNPLDDIAANVPQLDLYQVRDWPHRRGDEIAFNLLEMPLQEGSPGRRSHACENCGAACLCIHDNVMCWKCKGTFCLHCTADPNTLHFVPMEQILKDGFGKCHSCQEPLRSISLVSAFRSIIEMMNQPNFDESRMFSSPSLLQEAEDALARGQECAKRDREQAILEFTHAINALNYLTSFTGGTGLILRAFDILLISHSLRAQLEDNQALYDAVIAAYPKASVKPATGKEQEWHLSKSGFEALFYPLQANIMCGSQKDGGGFTALDQRTLSLDAALASPEFGKQAALAKVDLSYYAAFKSARPHCDSIDHRFESLKGTWRGLYTHEIPPVGGMPACSIGGHNVALFTFIQFIRVFPTNLAAAEDIRIQIETKDIGEEGSLQAKRAENLEKMIRDNAKKFGIKDLQRVYVIKGSTHPAVSVVAAVGNVATKVFIHMLGAHDDIESAACYLAAKALAYLERQLKDFRMTTSRSGASRVPCHHHPDLTVCAYCGKDVPEEDLKSCSRCKLTRYCGVNCQKKHWQMKGPFSHKPLCQSVVETSSSN